MLLFRALAKNMAASYFAKKGPYGFEMEVTLLYVFILCFGVVEHSAEQLMVSISDNAKLTSLVVV